MTKKKFFTTVLVTLLLSSIGMIHAQNHNYYINKEFFTEGLYNAHDVYTSPLRWNADDWLKAGIFAGATILLFVCDKQVQDFVQGHKSNVLSSVTDMTNLLGDGYVVLPAEALLYCYGAIAKDEKARRISLEMIESFAVSGIAVTTMKFLTHRHRPSGSSNDWDGPSLSSHHMSFPSGHACVAFSWATVLAEEFKEKPVVGIVSYSLAAGTAFARVYKNQHWISDVFVGGLLSHLITKKILSLHEQSNGRSLTIQPTITGICLTFHL